MFAAAGGGDATYRGGGDAERRALVEVISPRALGSELSSPKLPSGADKAGRCMQAQR